MAEETNPQGAPTNPVPQPMPVPQPTQAPQPTPQATPVPTPTQAPQPTSMPPAPMPQGMPQSSPAPGYVSVPPTPPVLMELSGGMKFGWLVIGLLMGIPGIVLSWLVNVDKMPQVKSEAIKFTVIGLVINIVGAIIVGFILSATLFAFIYELSNTIPYYY